MLYMVGVVLAAVAVAGNVIHNGKCPELPAVSNFNATAYQGVWYEISKYPHENDATNEKKGKCSSTEYKLEGQDIKVKETHVVDSVQSSVEGTAKLAPDANSTGKLIISMKSAGVTRDTPVWILSTDYANYVVAYGCQFDEKNSNHQDFTWVMSRNKKLEAAAKTAVDNFIKATTELDATKLVQTDFSEEACKVNSVVTEKPATA